jgi:hypothetical protein
MMRPAKILVSLITSDLLPLLIIAQFAISFKVRLCIVDNFEVSRNLAGRHK